MDARDGVRPKRRRPGPIAAALALLAAGAAIGFGAARLTDDPHTATVQTKTGIVYWSNEQTRLIAFEEDGAVRDPLQGDTIYSVIGEGWEDVGGTIHSGQYPTCLASERTDTPVSTDRHRVRLDVVHRAIGQQPQHIAVQVHCLD